MRVARFARPLAGVSMTFVRLLFALLAGVLLSLPPAARAQDPVPPTQLSQDLLDSLLAPIALYPDQLLSQVLMASTYPLEVVEAARFVKANPGLKGEALDRALQGKTWDASVLSLRAFPQVLDMMDAKLEWTQRLGDAFLADEAAVMHTVQSLRLRAQQAGNLQSTPQQNVIVQDRAIVIEPAQPEYVYVPVYNPEIIYGPWWAPAYAPWYWYPGPIWGYPRVPVAGATGAGIFWGTAMGDRAYNWGWCRPNWGGYDINVNVHGNNPWVEPAVLPRPVRQQPPNWSHAPEHRRGVAYRDPGTAQRYRPANPGAIQTRESYRGPRPDVRLRSAADPGAVRPRHGRRRRPTRRRRPATGDAGRVRCSAEPAFRRRPRWRGSAPATRAGAPARPPVAGVAAAGAGATREPATRPAGAPRSGSGWLDAARRIAARATRPAPRRRRAPADAPRRVRPRARPRRGRAESAADRPARDRATSSRDAARARPTPSQPAERPRRAADPQPAYRPESRPSVQRDARARANGTMSRPAAAERAWAVQPSSAGRPPTAGGAAPLQPETRR